MGAYSKRYWGWCRVVMQFLAIFLCFSAMVFPTRAETVPISPSPATASPTAGQLEYYGTSSGYLCKSYPPNSPQPYSPTGTDKNAVALAMAKLMDANAEAIYQGDGSYDGKTDSWYLTHPTWPNSAFLVVTQYICPVGSEGSPAYNCAVIPNSRNNQNECCPCGYSYDSGQDMCVVNPSRIAACSAQCPTVAARETPYTLDSGGKTCSRPDQCPAPNVIDPITHKCGPPPPPPCTAIDKIPPLPTDDKDFACTQSLDKGAGNDVDKVCPPLNAKLTGADGQMQCLAKKLKALSPPIPYNGPSSTIRTEEYQKHLLEIWKKSEDVKNKRLTAMQKQACAARIADVEAQMEHHQIDFKPSDKGGEAQHVLGNAFDIPKSVATALKERATMTKIKTFFETNFPNCISCLRIPLVTGNVQDYVNSPAVNPPACNLDWGGSFGDKVHFQLPPPPKK